MTLSNISEEQPEELALLNDPAVADFWEAVCSSFESNRHLRRLIIDAPSEESSRIPRLRGVFLRDRSGETGQLGMSQGIDSSVFLEFNLRTSLENLVVEYQQAAWGTPVLTGLWGDSGTQGESPGVLYIGFEQPLQFNSFSDSDKSLMERLQVDRFCTDFLLKTGETLYDTYTPGGDPPDFLCTDHGRRVSLECTRFSVQNRREAHAFLGKTRDFVMMAVERNRRDFAHLRGLNVFLRFGDGEDVSGYPPKPNMTSQLAEIVEALKSYNKIPPSSEDSMALEGLGENPKAQLSFGGSLRAARFNGALPETRFFTRVGFELALGYQTVHTHDSAWNELQSQISAKDRPENEDLLISVGAPNQEGLVFLSEELIAETALASGHELSDLQYLKRVYIHFWSSKRIVQLWPRRREIAPRSLEYDLIPSHSRLRLP